jgi:hypothetical protein
MDGILGLICFGSVIFFVLLLVGAIINGRNKAKAAAYLAGKYDEEKKKEVENANIPEPSIKPSNTVNATKTTSDYLAEIQLAKENSDRLTNEVVKKYEFLVFRVSGVTFKNDDKKSRQTILRKIKFRDEEFEEEVIVETKKYDFEGSPAIGIYVNDQQIGNVPKDKVSYLIDNWKRLDTITNLEIVGGGKDENGDRLNYGAELTMRFFKEVPVNSIEDI